ncbi:TPA: DUF551 domain-containing protein [Citrobacter freundii]
MSTITKERLIKIQQWRETYGPGSNVVLPAEEAEELARIALASLEAEAVCVIDQSNLDYLKSGSDADVWPASRTEMGDVLLYRSAPPAPVSVPAAMEMDDDFDSAFEHGKAVGWNAYRAAMLQGAVQPQNQQQNIPENIPVNTPCKEAPEYIWLQTAGVWPENGEFSELTWCSDNQHEDDTLYVRADVVSGNSPVITDGWVLVPVEPTAEMLQSGISAHYERNQIQIHDRPAPGPMECAYVAMLAAAPQQEVK